MLSATAQLTRTRKSRVDDTGMGASDQEETRSPNRRIIVDPAAPPKYKE
jgi:hypothetical protein